jgi:hypothetical protein
MPRLIEPLVLDGDLNEWASAACVPARYLTYAEIIHMPRWRGPADAGIEFYCAWNGDGLCLAAVVADQDVRNDQPDAELWRRDCLEVFVDGRAGGEFMKPPYSAGAYQLLVRPPISKERAAHIAVNPRDGTVGGLEVAGKRTATGYVVEALIPWSAFPDFAPRPGSEFGLQFRLDDFDRRDRKDLPHVALSYRGARELWQSPQRLIRWALVERLETGTEVPLGPLAALDCPPIFGYTKSLPIAIEVGRVLSGRVGSVQLTVTSVDGEIGFDRVLPASTLDAPWDESVGVRVDLAPELPSDGYHVVKAVVNDRDGEPLGFVSRSVLFVGRAVEEALADLRAANVSELAQTEPFKAAAYLGAGACLEKFKRALELSDIVAAVEAQRELTARLDVLDDGELGPEEWDFYDLLTLAADPEAQVVVEFRDPQTAEVTFYWGAIPLASATVREFATAEHAAEALKPAQGLTTMSTAGCRLIAITTPSNDVARRAIALIAAGKPVRAADVDAMRADLVSLLAPKAEPPEMPAGRRLLCGDVHMHTFYSDGRPSPVGLALETMYCFMDYNVLTDHNTIEGARVGKALLKECGFAQPFVVGEEITTEWAHMNAYPLREAVSWKLSAYEIIKAAHVQGAVIHWNHPYAVASEWANPLMEGGIGGTALDAWEHIPRTYHEWKQAGKLPVLVGSTDSHDGCFCHAPERTIIFAPTADGDDLAEAIRSGHAVLLAWKTGELLYGSDDMVALVWAALAEGNALKSAKADYLRNMLKDADLSGIIEASEPRRTPIEEYAVFQ